MSKILKAMAFAVAVSAGGAGAAQAEEGLYYGAALGLAKSESESAGIGMTEGNDMTFGVVLGYRMEYASGTSVAIEGTYDGTSRNLMTSVGVPTDACTDWSPDWCEVHTIARIRGVYGTTLSNGIEVLSMAGIASVAGLAEDGPGNYVDTTATGFTLGVGGQKPVGNGMLRVELVYDRFEGSEPGDYEKNLDILSLRTVFTF
ncbi:hypothetical protein EU803_08155 [Loktanella sp. IMCC34160]|uniref:outer membrane beta-barrel protein n=1 Tax=Loktanella sp. IMCC34160 TaxID=2510646 RepID=UPI00101C3240|nr:outer membrane beta-barrel protein [Loktanella sp. IMCC34160]RYG92388.1 hypothetical protein EU803_08155 [Loktanella sp. IMCC34160]